MYGFYPQCCRRLCNLLLCTPFLLSGTTPLAARQDEHQLVDRYTPTVMLHEAEERLGSAFDLVEFHALLLKNGPLPLRLLRDEAVAWVPDDRKSISP